MRTNWKKRALEAEDRANKAEQYAVDYGNATGTCSAGYWQHPGYVCHRSGADRSVSSKCGLSPKEQRAPAEPVFIVE